MKTQVIKHAVPAAGNNTARATVTLTLRYVTTSGVIRL